MSSINDAFALSYTQESLWLLDRLARKEDPAYNESLAFHIRGPLRPELLHTALSTVTARHEALRTVFVETAEGLRGLVREPAADAIEIVDLRQQPRDTAELRARELVQEAYQQPFDLAEGPLWRAVVVLVDAEQSLLALTVHHIAVDGWSFGVLLDELRQEYVALVETGNGADLPRPAVGFSECAKEQREAYERGEFEEQLGHWASALKDGPELIKLPTDRPRPPAQSFRGATRSVRVPRPMVRQLVERCRQECGSTEFGVLLAAYALLLHRYAQQDQVTVGSTVLNRTDVDHLGVVGCFVNTVALPFAFEEQLTVRGLLERTGESLMEMLEHQDAPYPKVLERLGVERDPSHSPVFQAMMTLLGERRTLRLGEGLACTPFPMERVAAKFDLLLYVVEDEEEIEFELEFNTDLLDPETAERLLTHYVHLLGELAVDLDIEVSRVPILPEPERRLITEEWNGTAVEYPQGDVVDLIRQQAARTPDAVAVEFRGQCLTYAELDRRTDRIAAALVARPDRGSDFVGVYLERSIDMVVALLSIEKAGLAYVPIDPEYPADRVRYMIEDSAVDLVLTQEDFRDTVTELGAVPALPAELELQADGAEAPHLDLRPDSRAYMIYTSGSTGRPKGVVNRHAALFNRLYWMQSRYRLGEDDRVLQKTPFSFDVSVWEFFWPLMFGARIVMAEPGGHRDPEYLKQVIRDRGVTTLHFVPSMLNVFLEEDELTEACTSLRRVFCSGEALPYSTVEKFAAALPCELHNLYGPTEAAIDVSYWPCTLDYPGRVVPIGRPIDNIQLFVVDRHLELQPVGVPGELCIAGVGLAEGYHNRPDLTEKAFVANPFDASPGARMYRTGDLARYLPDGQIEYLGRIDNQIKLRGFRIELGEIEAAVQALPSVREAAVILHENGAHRMLVAYVVSDDFRSAEAKEQLRLQLPDFMVPQVFMTIAQVPTTVNGKLDRRALPDPLPSVDADDDGSAAPVTEQERVLAEIWRDVLGVPQAGVDSSFFRLGGDSITSIRVAARLRELGYRVEVKDIFAMPTIRELAQQLATETERTGAVALAAQDPLALVGPEDRRQLPDSVTDGWPLTLLQSGMIYHSMLHEDSPVYHDIFSYDIQAPLDRARLTEAIRWTTAAHPQLRSCLDLSGFDEPLQLVHRDVEPHLFLADLTGLTSAEQDAALDRWTEEEKRRGFDFENAPLIRFVAHDRGPERFTLSLSFHHVILDGWSVALVVEQVRRGYAELLGGRTLPAPTVEQPSFGCYVALEQEARQSAAQAAFWSSTVAGFSPSRLSSASTEREADPASTGRALPEEITAGLRARCDELGVPLKSALLGLHLKTLGRLTGTAAVVTGLVVNGRPEVAGGEEMAGLFLNTLPVPLRGIDGEATDLFRRAFAFEQQAVAHRRFPLAEILRLSGHDELFDTVFNYTDFHVYRGEEETAAVITGARYFEQTNFGIVVHAHQDHFSGQLTLTLNHDAARFDASVVGRYLDEFLDAARAAVGTGQAACGPEADHELVRRVGDVVAKALGLASVGPDDDFLELGLDSITAIRVVARLKRLGARPAMKDLFDHSTPRRLAARLAAGPTGRQEPRSTAAFELVGGRPSGLPDGVVDAYPATALQLDMVEEHDRDVAQAVYHDVFSYHLDLPLDADLLRATLQGFVDTHETLRTAFDLAARPVPLQLVFGHADPALEVLDLSALSEREQQRALDEWFEHEKGVGFDWSVPSLMRFTAHRRGPGAFTLSLSFHHSVIDGWSLSLFVRDLVRRYTEALETGRVPRAERVGPAYRDYVAAEVDSRKSAQQRAFWMDELRGTAYHPLTAAAWDGSAERWAETKLSVDPATHQALSALANRAGVPLKQVLLAAHLVAVGLVQQSESVLTAVFSGGRLEEEGAEEAIGLFLNFLPFRQDVGARTWLELVRETFANERRTLPHRRYPLRDIRAGLGRDRVTDVVFNYTQFTSYADVARGSDGRSGAGVLTGVRWFEHTDFALLVNVGHDLLQEQLVITLNADGRRLPPAFLETFAELYDAILTELAVDEHALATAAPGRIRKLAAMLGGHSADLSL
ncbi:non-ribosomal peptide synthetase [Streptacidiphilus jiangxiensis]|uniref:Amino acid adenylation domain-containing protein n=1 Tax=Streptacidiphilus jiangxiensis TaxID=235985 RepID=A0A1H7VN63_STRJI|nr:non-ribosomal peptide synthetase [Streptacidiphilus jiangxiensis]SEM10285.1 amino acid adenylation domain-containing protein [Streptacidiphilus jiangxiensis]